MPRKSSPNHLAPRLVVAAILLAAAALTGCSAGTSASESPSEPCLFGSAHASPEPISTLGENYTLPPDGRHRTRLRDVPNNELAISTHRTL